MTFLITYNYINSTIKFIDVSLSCFSFRMWIEVYHTIYCGCIIIRWILFFGDFVATWMQRTIFSNKLKMLYRKVCRLLANCKINIHENDNLFNPRKLIPTRLKESTVFIFETLVKHTSTCICFFSCFFCFFVSFNFIICSSLNCYFVFIEVRNWV